MQFTAEMRKKVDPVWQACHEHPFVKGIGDGSLELERFRYWIRQDYVYLKDYCRVFALASAKAEDLETMSFFAGLLDATLNTEMSLHRQYAEKFGISLQELEFEVKSPTTQAYTDFLLNVSYSGGMPELMAALLPCFWGFLEIGTRLKETGDTSMENPYRDWIEMYSSPDFQALCEQTRELMDRLAGDCTAEKKKRLEDIFITSSRFEYLFWEMSHNLEQWPV